MIINEQIFKDNKLNKNTILNRIQKVLENTIKKIWVNNDRDIYSNKELLLINNFIKKIYVCNTEKDIYSNFIKFINQNFPNVSGILYVFDNSKEVWDITHYFGKHVSGNSKFEFPIKINNNIIANLVLFSKNAKNLSILSEIKEHISISLKNIMEKNILKKEATCDPLTGLYNRRFMEETFEREVCRAKRQKNDIGIIMLDIDFFKRINDNFGHDAGDRVLKEISNILKNNIRCSDVICRYGGEEFVLILPDITKEACVKRANLLLKEIRKTLISYGEYDINITASLGVSIFNHYFDDIHESINNADSALYQAKRSGRNKIVIH